MTIPIVFEIGSDPVQNGLVASLNQPGGNITGVTAINSELNAKRLGLLCEMVPGAARLGVLTQRQVANVWTGGALQEGSVAAGMVGLAPMYPA
jgi:ABC-type uncharacterized transport system substrate-binding protein